MSQNTKNREDAPAAPKPAFDREKAIAFLTAWYGTTAAALSQLYLSAEDVRIEAESSPEFRELLDAKAFGELHTLLDNATNQLMRLAPRVLMLPVLPTTRKDGAA